MVTDPSWSSITQQVIASQDQIGWKNFMEGLPSKLWYRAISHHCESIGSDLSPHRWMSTCLQCLHDLAWGMWEHRNHILHDEAKPREQKAIALLNQAVTQHYVNGPTQVDPEERRHYFSHSLINLLNRKKTDKQRWLTNFQAARKRHMDDMDMEEHNRQNTRLVHWIRHGRLQ